MWAVDLAMKVEVWLQSFIFRIGCCLGHHRNLGCVEVGQGGMGCREVEVAGWSDLITRRPVLNICFIYINSYI